MKFKIVWDSKEKEKSVVQRYHAMIVLYELRRVAAHTAVVSWCKRGRADKSLARSTSSIAGRNR